MANGDVELAVVEPPRRPVVPPLNSIAADNDAPENVDAKRKSGKEERRRARNRLLCVHVTFVVWLLIGVGLSVYINIFVVATLNTRARTNMDQLCIKWTEAIDLELRTTMYRGYSVSGLFANSFLVHDGHAESYLPSPVEAYEFEAFTHTADGEGPPEGAIMWLPRIVHSARQAYETNVSAVLGSKYQITALPDHEVSPSNAQYYPVQYGVTPAEYLDRSGWGIDHLSSSTRRSAILSAVSDGRAHGSGIEKEPADVVSVDNVPIETMWVYFPVVGVASTGANVTIGVVAMALAPPALVDDVLSRFVSRTFRTQVFDVTGTSLTAESNISAFYTQNADLPLHSVSLVTSYSVQRASREWMVQCTVTESFWKLTSNDNQIMQPLIVMAFFLVTGVFAWRTATSYRAIAAKVRLLQISDGKLQKRTTEIKAVVSAIADPLVVFDRTGRITAANSAALTSTQYARTELIGLNISALLQIPQVQQEKDDHPVVEVEHQAPTKFRVLMHAMRQQKRSTARLHGRVVNSSGMSSVAVKEKEKPGDTYLCELNVRRKDGTIFPAEVSSGSSGAPEHHETLATAAAGTDGVDSARMAKANTDSQTPSSTPLFGDPKLPTVKQKQPPTPPTSLQPNGNGAAPSSRNPSVSQVGVGVGAMVVPIGAAAPQTQPPSPHKPKSFLVGMLEQKSTPRRPKSPLMKLRPNPAGQVPPISPSGQVAQGSALNLSRTHTPRELTASVNVPTPVAAVTAALSLEGFGDVFVAVFRDISDSKQQLIKSRAEADEAVAGKEDFLAFICHELRNPLNAVMGMSHLLMDTTMDNEQKEMNRTVFSSAQTMASICNDVLDISKIEAKRLQLEQSPFSLVDMLRELDNAYRYLTSHVAQQNQPGTFNGSPFSSIYENVGWKLIVPDASVAVVSSGSNIGSGVTSVFGTAGLPLPATVYGDVFRLKQVLSNLLSNAFKFTRRGAVTLSVKVLEYKRVDGGGGATERTHRTGTFAENISEHGDGTDRSEVHTDRDHHNASPSPPVTFINLNTVVIDTKTSPVEQNPSTDSKLVTNPSNSTSAVDDSQHLSFHPHTINIASDNTTTTTNITSNPNYSSYSTSTSRKEGDAGLGSVKGLGPIQLRKGSTNLLLADKKMLNVSGSLSPPASPPNEVSNATAHNIPPIAISTLSANTPALLGATSWSSARGPVLHHSPANDASLTNTGPTPTRTLPPVVPPIPISPNTPVSTNASHNSSNNAHSVRIEFRVTDSGIGIAPNEIPNMFKPFSHTTANTLKRTAGTGLGLCIAKALTEAMSGDLLVESAVNVGSSFSFALPFMVQGTGGDIGTPSPQPPLALVSPEAKGRRLNSPLQRLRAVAAASADAEKQSADQLLSPVQPLPQHFASQQALLGRAAWHSTQATTAGLPTGQPLLARLPLHSSPPTATRHIGNPATQLMLGRVLIVEDNKVNQKLAKTLLTRAGIFSDVASDGLEAIHILLGSGVTVESADGATAAAESETPTTVVATVAATPPVPYDLVLMDVVMPFDGLKATKILRQRGFKGRIVGLSANATQGDMTKCYECGMDDFISKPFLPKDFPNKVLSILREVKAGRPSSSELRLAQAQAAQQPPQQLHQLQLVSGLESTRTRAAVSNASERP